MLNLDPSKLLVIALLAIVLLGPEKLPTVARQIGVGWRALSRLREKVESEVRESIPNLPSTSDIASMVRSPATLLNRLSADAPTEEVLQDEVDGPIEVPHDVPGSHIADDFAPPLDDRTPTPQHQPKWR